MTRCARSVRRLGIGVLISSLNDGNIFARWVALRSGAKLFQREANTLASKTARQKLLDFLFGWIPFRYLAVSSEARDSLERIVFYRRGAVVLFPNAVSLPEMPSHDAHPVPHILAVGRFTEQKDYQTLVSALARVKRGGAPFRATFVGDGQLRGRIERQIHDDDLDTHITLVGRLPHEHVREAYGAADMFVLSSRWEGSPNALLEAMSYGLPCISTAVGGVIDIMTDGKDGLLVPPGSPERLAAGIEGLLRDPGLRDRLGRAARERVEEAFSREARFKRLEELIRAT